MSFDLKKYIVNLPNQHNVGCCTSSASLLSVEMHLARTGNIQRFSRLYVYYMSRMMQGRIGQNGAELKITLDSMQQYGVATDSTWPFHFNRVNKEPSSAAIQEAQKYKLISYEYTTVDRYKEYLHREIPVIAGLHTGKMFWRLKGPLSKQVYKSINTTDNRNYRGHAITIIGYDDTLLGGSWIVANSLGLTWGDHGIGLVPYECNKDIGESYVITEFTGYPGLKISEN